jgi:hypothetical protein
LLGKLDVGEVVSRKRAMELFGDRVYDAPLVALAEAGTEHQIIEADIQKLASELRFESVHHRLDPERTIGQQLQSLRELTNESVQKLQSALDSAQVDQRLFPRRVLFARVGWMTYYAGPQIGDEKPVGGGENNKKNSGHELFNFKDFGGKLYGFVRASDRRINLERIDPMNVGDLLNDVLVIFVAKQRIVGWYRTAIVYKTEVNFPLDVSKEIRKRLKQAKTKTSALSATVLSVLSRMRCSYRCTSTHEIPGAVKGGFGQYNVCYQYQNNGRRKSASWINDAVSYVLNYDKENLLTNPNADNESEEAAVMSQEQAAGFQSNPAIRKAVEDFAMEKAHSALVKRHYTNFNNTSKSKPYDFTCQRDGKLFFVEVKGTQTLAPKGLILTRGEVRHITSYTDQCILVLVHSVKVSANGAVSVSGGATEVRESWTLRTEDLSPIQYFWAVS